MTDIINHILTWNKQRGFIEKGFNAAKQNTYTLSEELEVLDYEDLAYDLLNVAKLPEGFNHDDFAKHLTDQYATPLNELEARVEYVDKGIDHFFFSVGGMGAMNLSTEDILECFKYVLDANDLKPIGKVNADGKQTKPSNFDMVDPKHKIREVIKRAWVD
jgi:hypothetical protein